MASRWLIQKDNALFRSPMDWDILALTPYLDGRIGVGHYGEVFVKPGFAYDGIDQKEGHFQNYADYSRTLRAWLVAYGIGGPVLFLTNEKVTERVSASPYGDQIVAAFLIGVALQIGLALINKWGAWHMYAGAGDKDYQSSWRYKFWGFVNAQSWIDFWLDVISLIAFVFATWRVLSIFLVTGNGA